MASSLVVKTVHLTDGTLVELAHKQRVDRVLHRASLGERLEASSRRPKILVYDAVIVSHIGLQSNVTRLGRWRGTSRLVYI